jgi:hypothetical protein
MYSIVDAAQSAFCRPLYLLDLMWLVRLQASPDDGFADARTRGTDKVEILRYSRFKPVACFVDAETAFSAPLQIQTLLPITHGADITSAFDAGSGRLDGC